jgi:hypothetical protein
VGERCCFCDRLESAHDYEGCRHNFVADPIGSYAEVLPVGGASGSSAGAVRPVEPSLSMSRSRSRAVSAPTCACCGRAFVGRRRSAKFCGDLCRRRARRDRCGEAA